MTHNPNNNINLNDEIQKQFERYDLLLQEKQKRSKRFHEFSQKNQDTPVYNFLQKNAV